MGVDVPTSESTGLLHLPNELLYQIFEDIGDDELYRLAMTSQRLQVLTLPLYFKRRELNLDVGWIILYGDRMTALPAIRCARFVTSFKSIECWLNPGPEKMFREVRSLHGLVSRLSYIGDLKLNLSHIDPWMRKQMSSGNTKPIALEEWKQVLTGLLGAALGSTCPCLTVAHGDSITHISIPPSALQSSQFVPRAYDKPILRVAEGTSAHRAPAMGAYRKFSAGLKSTLKSLTRKRLRPSLAYDERQAEEPVIDDSVDKEPLDEGALDAHLDALAPQPLDSEWVDEISQPPKTTLLAHTPTKPKTFNLHSSMLFDLPFCSWTIKTLNTVPITTLSFRGLNTTSQRWTSILSSVTLLALTEFSPGDSKIDFADLGKFLMRHPSISTLDLSDFVSINYPPSKLPQYCLPRLRKFVAPHGLAYLVGDNFPELDSITILSENLDDELVDRALINVATRSSGESIFLKLLYKNVAEGWLVTVVCDGPSRNVLRSLHCVKSLDLAVGYPHGPASLETETVPMWLALFPALERVGFDGSIRANGNDRRTFIRAISKACPRIQTIRIGFQEHDVATWLAISPSSSLLAS